MLRDYVKFAKDKFNPVLSDEAGQKMISYYVEMRKVFILLIEGRGTVGNFLGKISIFSSSPL